MNVQTKKTTYTKGVLRKLGHLQDENENEILQELGEYSPSEKDGLNCSLLRLLISVIPQKWSGRKRKSDGELSATSDDKTPKRASLPERRRSSIQVVSIDADLDASIDDLKEELASDGMSFQPTLICVGDVFNADGYRVVINNIVYSFTDCLSALDFTFKVFFGLDCKYPLPCEMVWLFIQSKDKINHLGSQNIDVGYEFDQQESDEHESDGDLSYDSDDSDTSDVTSKLYYSKCIPRSAVSEIVNNTSDYVDSLLDNLKSEILQNSPKNHKNGSHNCKIDAIFETHKALLKNFSTEKKCFNYFEKCETFIPPESYVTGERQDFKKENGKMRLVHLPVSVQFIEISRVLKKFLELPGLFDTTISYMKNRLDDEIFINSIIQNEVLRKVSLIGPDKITIPLTIAFDEYEPNNPLGPHRGISKCGAMNVSIPCLPPEYQSKIEKIFLLLLFNALDRVVYSNKVVSVRAIEELNKLCTDGITLLFHDRGVASIQNIRCRKIFTKNLTIT
ncbi:hypothetical protein QAD02_001799 [Eretmocerus hayati]|uniref:Uncharacterized protein n=1 Tax=Eretmocerus hayati TaxID=131215 RepID=A0ACC2NH46_9HYME|nr:hypothetical protein QAD02_001799 [Eretmocerus hayati]